MTFCKVGRSPDRRTKKVMSENPKAAMITQRIPSVWFLIRV
jgi:hypothetical protein